MSSTNRWYALAIGAVITCATAIATFAARRTSITFDETYFIASGVRAVSTGDVTMTPDHPPLMQFLYGGAAKLAGAKLPQDGFFHPGNDTLFVLGKNPGDSLPLWGYYDRYQYGQRMIFGLGVDPIRQTFYPRVVALVIAAGLGVLVAIWTWTYAGPRAALLAVAIVMFLPEVLTHAGIAYNDLPLAAGFVAALWCWQRVTAAPTLKSIAIAATVTALAVGVKFSAVAVIAAAGLLVVIEAIRRRLEHHWISQILLAIPISVPVAWLVLAIMYHDPALDELQHGIAMNAQHWSAGHLGVSYFLGKEQENGVWYFFPLALLFKTPVPLQALALLGFVGLPAAWKLGRGRRELLIVVGAGALVFNAFLLSSRLNIGVRHAMPLWPLFAIAVAVGVDALWNRIGRPMRAGVAAVIVGYAACTLAYFPWFISYLTEWIPNRETEGHRVMIDSNIDWGQGLIALHDWQRANNVSAVYLSYFGSGLPSSYGVRYVRLASYFSLRPDQPASPDVRWVVISATNLWGIYLRGDLFKVFRATPPDAVIGGSLYAYHLKPDGTPGPKQRPR